MSAKENKQNIERYLLIFLVFFTFAIRFIYVFYFTDYKNLITGDMLGYWDKAIRRYSGDIFGIEQWESNAPFFHFYLAFIFNILNYFGKVNLSLEIVLLLNIFYSSASLIFFYLISEKILRSNFLSFLVTLLYGLFFPLIYFNAFLLTENIAIPILITTIYLIFTLYENKSIMFLTGIFFGIAVSIRPSLSLVVLIFFLYIFYAGKKSISSFFRSVLFFLGVLLFVFFVSVEINNISRGKVRSLYPYTGAAFFLTQCEHSYVFSNNSAYSMSTYNFYITSLFSSSNSNLKPYTATCSLSDNKQFFKDGLECVKKKPLYLLLESIKRQEALFFNNFYPYNEKARWIKFLVKPFNFLVFFITVSSGLLFFLIRDSEIDFKKVAVLLLLPATVFFNSIFFIPEQRYFYPAVFAMYILFFLILSKVRKYKLQTLIYYQVLLVIWLFFIMLR